MPRPTPPLRSPLLLRWGLLGAMFGLALLAGCSVFSTDDEPLPDSTFTDVLTELHMASARQSGEVATPRGLRDSIFSRYDVAPSEFEATLQHYARRPDRFETLYQTVIDTLQALRYPNRSDTNPQGIPDSVRNRSREQPDTP